MLRCGSLITKLRKIDVFNFDLNNEIFKEASEIFSKGGLVAFPTETVYGLGANALNEQAVKNIYKAKGRPSDNPLIVHIADKKDLEPLVREVPEKASIIIERFWPGSITLIFKKSDIIPSVISGGLDTVAIRLPKNEIARSLIAVAKCPIAAPSANSSGRPSPTLAEHVLEDLNGKIDMIIDGGACEVGLESTVLDITSEFPCILRPGAVTREMLEDAIGRVDIDKEIFSEVSDTDTPKSPGMKYTHYSPKANVTIFIGDKIKVAEKINNLVFEAEHKNVKACVIATEQTKSLYHSSNVLVVGDKEKPETIAANLFKTLRECDSINASEVFTESFSEDELGLAIMNRLKKASGYNICKVD